MCMRVNNRLSLFLVLLHKCTSSLAHSRPIPCLFAAPFWIQGHQFNLLRATQFVLRNCPSTAADPPQSAATCRRGVFFMGRKKHRNPLWSGPFPCKAISDAVPRDDDRPAAVGEPPGSKRRKPMDDTCPRPEKVSKSVDKPGSRKKARKKGGIDPRRNQFRVKEIEVRPVALNHEGPDRPGFERKMTKDEINCLPLCLPLKKTGQNITLVRNKEQLSRALTYLGDERILGFDTETKPAFVKGERYLPSLLQLSGKDRTIVIQVKKVGFPPELRQLLSNPRIIKAGVGVDGDIRELQEVERFEPAGFRELSDMARDAGIQNIGLRGMAAVLLGFRISKGQQRSNWARDDLSEAQINYAALDSWACRAIYIQIKELLDAAASDPTPPA